MGDTSPAVELDVVAEMQRQLGITGSAWILAVSRGEIVPDSSQPGFDEWKCRVLRESGETYRIIRGQRVPLDSAPRTSPARKRSADMDSKTIGRCEHGQPAKYAFVMDRTRRNDRDPWGDVEGPANVVHLDAIQRLHAAYVEDHPDDESRFLIGFLHIDLCRTEEPDDA